MRKSLVNNVPLDEFRQIVAQSQSMSDILRAIGLENKGHNADGVKNRLIRDNISASHIFLNPCKHKTNRKIWTLEEMLVKDSHSVGGFRRNLKARLLKEKLLENRCSICGIGEEWNGKAIVHILDHIDGDGFNNVFENLRMVCPNCNSQLDTFAGRNSADKIRPTCEQCGKEKDCPSKVCGKCSGKTRRRCDRPSLDILTKQVQEIGYCAIARQYGVSDKAIRKWFHEYGLSAPISEFHHVHKTHARSKKVGRSGYKGVGFKQKPVLCKNKWVARIFFEGKNIEIGRFSTAREAALAYDIKAVELLGDAAITNKELGTL